jgi:hypothetical protein
LGHFQLFRKFVEILASQGAPPILTTPVESFPPVSTTPVAKLLPVSMTPAENGINWCQTLAPVPLV